MPLPRYSVYLIGIVALMVLAPLASVLLGWHRSPDAAFAPLTLRWAVFWTWVDSLFTAGIRQIVQPRCNCRSPPDSARRLFAGRARVELRERRPQDDGLG